MWGYRGVESLKKKWEIKIMEQCGVPRCGKWVKKVGNKNNGIAWGTKVWKVGKEK